MHIGAGNVPGAVGLLRDRAARGGARVGIDGDPTEVLLGLFGEGAEKCNGRNRINCGLWGLILMDSASSVKAEILQSCFSGKNLLFPCCLVAPWVPLELHILSADICFPRQICLGLLKWLWFAGTEWNGHDVLSVKKNLPQPRPPRSI